MEQIVLVPLGIWFVVFVTGGILRWIAWGVSGRNQAVVSIVGGIYDLITTPVQVLLVVMVFAIVPVPMWVYLLLVLLPVLTISAAVWEIVGGVKGVREKADIPHVTGKLCPHCGTEQFNKLNAVCLHCGRDMTREPAAEVSNTEQMPTWKRIQLEREKSAEEEEAKNRATVCPGCGATTTPGDSFCDQCGTRLA